MSETLKGRKRTKEQIEAIAESKKGWKPSLQTKMKISSANYGKRRTEEQRRTMSEAQQKRYAEQKDE